MALVIANDPKAVRIEPYILVVFESRGGTQIARIVIEGTTAEHALAALWLCPRRSVGRCTPVVVAPAIFDPLRCIARHIVNPECIGRKRSGIDRLLHGIAGAAETVGLVLFDGPSPGIGRRRAGSGDVLPFAFRGKPVSLPGLLRQPCEIALGVVPIQIRDGPPAAPKAAVIRLLLATAFGETCVPLLERDFAPADVERLCGSKPDEREPRNRTSRSIPSRMRRAVSGQFRDIADSRGWQIAVRQIAVRRLRCGWWRRGAGRPSAGCWLRSAGVARAPQRQRVHRDRN